MKGLDGPFFFFGLGILMVWGLAVVLWFCRRIFFILSIALSLSLREFVRLIAGATFCSCSAVIASARTVHPCECYRLSFLGTLPRYLG